MATEAVALYNARLTQSDTVPRPPSPEILAERIDQLEEARRDSSRRLHLEIDELKRRFEAMQSQPMEVENIRFPPRVVAAIVAAVVTVIGGMYATTYPLRSDVRDILTKFQSKEQIEAVQNKLNEQQTNALNKAIDQIDKRQQLQAIELQELKEMVLKIGAR